MLNFLLLHKEWPLTVPFNNTLVTLKFPWEGSGHSWVRGCAQGLLLRVSQDCVTVSDGPYSCLDSCLGKTPPPSSVSLLTNFISLQTWNRASASSWTLAEDHPYSRLYSRPPHRQVIWLFIFSRPEREPNILKLQSTQIVLSESESEVVSNSLWPCGLYPTRLLRPWDSPGKNTGVGCHFLLQGIFPTQGSNPGLPHCRQTL